MTEFKEVREGAAVVRFAIQAKKHNDDDDKDNDDDFSGDVDESVFYNKPQIVNRDLSITAIQTFVDTLAPKRKVHKRRANGIRILEALSASGLRSIRYAKELNGVEYIIANDIDPSATKCIAENVIENGISVERIKPNCDDAIELMYRLGHDQTKPKLFRQSEEKTPEGTTTTTPGFVPLLQQEMMDVVDLDPYGSASPFLDAAITCIEEGGMMCVTCTDAAVLCGKYPETSLAKYGSTALNSDYCHEMGIRVLLCFIERTANRHKKYIKPLLSLSINFYMRVFVQVFTQAAEVKLSIGRMSYVLQCTKCSAYSLQPVGIAKERKKRARKEDKQQQAASGEDISTMHQINTIFSPPIPARSTNFSVHVGTTSYGGHKECPCCQSSMWLAGPIYNQPIHDLSFVENCLTTLDASPTSQRVLGAADRVRALLVAAIEEINDVPLYYSLPRACSSIKLSCPPLVEITSALGRLGYTCSQTHCTPDGLKTTAPIEVLYGVLLKRWLIANPDATYNGVIKVPPIDCTFEVDMKYDVRSKRGSKKFLPNPEKDWGPKARHKSLGS